MRQPKTKIPRYSNTTAELAMEVQFPGNTRPNATSTINAPSGYAKQANAQSKPPYHQQSCATGNHLRNVSLARSPKPSALSLFSSSRRSTCKAGAHATQKSTCAHLVSIAVRSERAVPNTERKPLHLIRRRRGRRRTQHLFQATYRKIVRKIHLLSRNPDRSGTNSQSDNINKTK